MTNTVIFESAARAFLQVLAGIRDRETDEPGQWERPGLGVWTVRGLAGHTSRAIITVGEYLAAGPPDGVLPGGASPSDGSGCPDAETYLLDLAGAGADHEAVAARGTAAGEALGDDPVGSLTETLDRTLVTLATQPVDRIVSVVGGRTIPLAEYLRTRVFELVVHTIDLSRATGIPHAIPVRALEEAGGLAARAAARSGRGDALLLAATGRGPLPEGFSVV
ncbi:maleylpyruvate isomerase N-terminal domain-containing protein [Leifsonia bigeumensis]|uniref:Maleylpyruvate isomerase N-terminal domain-containing protein n=1 Tax=Leifsonella bigeumensis TaxID=433643 RepID=A0ABP7F090_9MICO